MTLKAQATHGLKWQVIELAGRQTLSLVVFGALSRLLEPAAFGLFGLVSVYLTFVGMFASQGIGAALIQRRDLTPEHLDTAYWFSLGCAGLLCGGTMLLAGPVSALFGEPHLAVYLRWASLILVINSSSTIHNTLFVREMDFRRPAIRLLLSNLVGGAVGVSMAFANYGVWALIGQQLAVALTSAAFLWSASPFRPGFQFSYARFRELRSVSSSVFATSLLWFLSSRLDQLIISRFAGVQTLGLYIIGCRLPELAKLITHQPISQVSMPALAKLQHDRELMRKAIYDGTQLNALISFAVFIGVASVASDLVPLVFGAKWIDAGILCSLLAVYNLVTVLQVFVHPSLVTAGANRDYVILNISQVIGVLLACLIGIQFGAAYVALGLVINALLGVIPAQYLLHKWIGLDPREYGRRCLVPAMAASAMFVMVWLAGRVLPLEAHAIVRLTMKVLLGAATYLGVIWVMAPDTLKKLFALLLQALQRGKKTVTAPAV